MVHQNQRAAILHHTSANVCSLHIYRCREIPAGSSCIRTDLITNRFAYSKHMDATVGPAYHWEWLMLFNTDHDVVQGGDNLTQQSVIKGRLGDDTGIIVSMEH